MSKDKFVLVMDEDTQGLIINALLDMHNAEIKDGMDAQQISKTIIDVCNAPTHRDWKRGDCYAR